MRRVTGLLVLTVAVALPCPAQQLHPEGFGANATGGAGGQVIHVTTLAPDGPGSLRAAIDTPGPRIVVFDVAGTIDLGAGRIAIGGPHRPVWRDATQTGAVPPRCPYSDLTIDGTSAPPPGITIGGTVLIGYGASNIIMRNLRIRDNGYIDRAGADCICIVDGCRDILVDHCSLTWSRDEVVNPWGRCGDITFSWCIFQGYGPHGYGPLVGGGATRATIHHCLFAHNMGRNPRVSGPDRPNLDLPPDAECLVDIRNNVIYNWFNVGVNELAFRSATNVIGNRYLPGLSSDPRMPTAVTGNSVAYVEGNLSPVRPTDDLDQWLGAGHLAPPDWQAIYGPWEEGLRADQPFEVPPVATQDALTASDLVLALVGAWPRDPIDAAIVRTVRDGTGWAGVPNTRPSDYANRPPVVTAQAIGDAARIMLRAAAEDPDGEVVGWAWELGDGAVALGDEVGHRYAPGEYVAAAVALDDLGATGVARLKLKVREGEPIIAERLPEVAGERLAPSGAAAGEPPLTVTVPRTPPPAAGAFPGPEAWTGAARLLPFLMQQSRQQVEEAEMDARVLSDGARLYLRVDCVKPAADIRPLAFDSERWFYQGLEVCVAPQWGRAPWYHLVVNANGEVLDAREYDRDWDPPAPWAVGSRAEGDRWIVEIALPITDIEASDAVALKVAQYRDKDEILIWPPQIMPDGTPAVSQMPLPGGFALLTF